MATKRPRPKSDGRIIAAWFTSILNLPPRNGLQDSARGPQVDGNATTEMMHQPQALICHFAADASMHALLALPHCMLHSASAARCWHCIIL